MISQGPRGLRLLLVLFGTAFVVSIVHYVDNVVNYHHYPQGGVAGLPAPSAPVIAVSWFVFTAAGLLGIGLFLRSRIVPAAAALAVYSFSGLVGLGHYLVPDAMAMPLWRHAHVIADVICGVLILGFAVWSVVAPRTEARPAGSVPAGE